MKKIAREEALARNLPRYYTGKPCLRGHKSERYTQSCACIACQRDMNDRFYAKVTKPGRHIAQMAAKARMVKGV